MLQSVPAASIARVACVRPLDCVAESSQETPASTAATSASASPAASELSPTALLLLSSGVSSRCVCDAVAAACTLVITRARASDAAGASPQSTPGLPTGSPPTAAGPAGPGGPGGSEASVVIVCDDVAALCDAFSSPREGLGLFQWLRGGGGVEGMGRRQLLLRCAGGTDVALQESPGFPPVSLHGYLCLGAGSVWSLRPLDSGHSKGVSGRLTLTTPRPLLRVISTGTAQAATAATTTILGPPSVESGHLSALYCVASDGIRYVT
jgi:hypothetical protein